VDRANLIMVYLLGVMWAAYNLGRGPALAAAVMSVVCFDFFFVPPYFSFAVSDSQYLLTFGIMLWAGLFISSITWRLRTQNEAARMREARTRALYRLSRELSEEPKSKEVIVKAWRHLEEFYATPVMILTPDEAGGLNPAAGSPAKLGFDEKEEAVARWVFDRGQEAGAGTNTLSASRALFLPLKGLQRTVGVLGLLPNGSVAADNPDQMQLLETFASEIGGAIASTQISETAGRAEAQVEVERMRNLVLGEFSENLDEPLTEVTKTAQSLLDAPSIEESVKRRLKEIRDKASHLSSVARDLPSMIQSRIRGRAPAPVREDGRTLVSDALEPGRILIIKGRKTKEQVLGELLDSMGLPESGKLLELVLEREKSGSTIVGPGLAIPHARVPGLDGIHASLGIAPEGIRAWASDRKAVRLVLLFVGPAEKLKEHLSFLAAVSRLFRDEKAAEELAKAESPDEALLKLRELESAG
jgi:K+-sensing histidine kinase KdpD